MRHISPGGSSSILAVPGLRFISKWKGASLALTETEFRSLLDLAADPKLMFPFQTSYKLSPDWFASRYAMAPDFLCAFLLAMRKVWNKSGKRAAILRYLCTAETCQTIRWEGAPQAQQFTVETLTREFNSKSAVQATIKDVEQALNRFLALQSSGEKSISRSLHFRRKA